MDPKPLSSDEISNAMPSLPGWLYERDALVKNFRFGTFRAAITYMHRASFLAETADHHPLWTNIYDTVNIRLSTHDAGNRVTVRDVDLAVRLEKLSREVLG